MPAQPIKKPEKKKPAKYKLTLKQENFCINYIKTGNASESYRQSYSTKNMKESSVNVKACYTLGLVKIRDRIEELRKPIYDELNVTTAKTINRLMQGQQFDFRKLYKKGGTLKQPHELDDNTAKAVVGVKHDSEGSIIEYKIIDVKGCTELMGKHQNIFEERDQKPVEIHINYGHRRKPDEEDDEEGA